MPATIVVGTQWGDEGKGKFTDLFAKEMSMVVRYQGGHNAGHTLVVNGESFALQLVPSGVLYDHIIPVIGNGVVVDPIVLLAEIDMLTAKGVDCSRLAVSGNAHLILPYHQEIDALTERLKSKPLDVMASGLQQVLTRKDVPDDYKKNIIKVVRELSSAKAREVLESVKKGYPKDGSKAVLDALDKAIKDLEGAK